MSEPEIQGMSVGCPHCPTRATCACPDGPERCPDNAECPCDKTVCPCAKHAKRPPDPPGCRDRSLLLGLGLLALVVIVLGAIGLRSCVDDDGGSIATDDTGAAPPVATDTAPPADTATPPTDAPPPTDATPPPATDPPETDPPATTTTAAPATTTTEPPGPAFDPPSVDSADVTDINDKLFGGQPAIGPGNCHVVTDAMSQTDQTGAAPLDDPTLDTRAICLANASVSQLPMLDGDFFVLVTVHDAPLTSTTNIAYQPGIGLDRPGVENAPPADSGEGLLQVAADTLGFGSGLDGWQQAQFFTVPGFGPSDIFGYVFAQDGSPYTGFAIPVEFLPPGTIGYGQSFGRWTEPGNPVTADDPSASKLVIGGAVPPCSGDCSPQPGRFDLEVTGGAGTFTGVEGPGGDFWLGDPDNTELLLKVLDGCDLNGHFWVFASSQTDVEYELTVTDTSSDQLRVYDSALGQPAPAIVDTEAFATCP